MNNIAPNKKRAKRAFYSLLIISITAAAVCAGGLVRELYIQAQSRAYYAALATMGGSSSEASTETEGQGNPQAGVSNQSTPEMTDGGEPVAAPPPNLAVIRENLPNVQGWIRCEGTGINYPVVQGADNDYYLDHLPNSTKNKTGSIFLDYRNAADFSDQNSVIYGHHIKSGAMFGALKAYKDQTYYDAHPLMLLYTPEQDYQVELIAGYVADAARETLLLRFADADAFERYLKEIRRRSLFESTVEVSTEDRLLTLCTCTYELSDARFILVGKLVAL